MDCLFLPADCPARLDAETRVLDAARTPVAVIASRAKLEKALAAHERTTGWPLNTGQKELAHHLVGAGTLLAAGVGPAGTVAGLLPSSSSSSPCCSAARARSRT